VISVLPEAALRHNLNLAVCGVVSQPVFSSAFTCVKSAFTGMLIPPNVRSKPYNAAAAEVYIGASCATHEVVAAS